MKACIIGARNLNGMTLMSIYTDIFKKYGIEYDVIYIDRLGIEETCDAKSIYPFHFQHNTSSNRYFNFLDYQINMQKFKKYAISIIKKEQYDFIVLWVEEMGWVFGNYLSKNYRKKYSVNVRDIWNKDRFYYINRFKRAVQNSAINTVSSPEFIPLLPEAEYLFVHSANFDIVKTIEKRHSLHTDDPIVISNIGTFRNDQYCFDLVDAFGNDNRFVIRFSGSGSERMAEYCISKGYSNVVCSGAFDPHDTAAKINGSSIINCAYGSGNNAESTKIPIRLYYAIYYGVPVLCTEGTVISKFANKLRGGIEIPENLKSKNGIADYVYSSYHSMDYCLMLQKMNEAMDQIESSHAMLEVKVCQALGLEVAT